jgi:hypothetical protein
VSSENRAQPQYRRTARAAPRQGDRRMASLKHSRKQFIIIYVRSFLHYRTKKRVFPKPPKKFIKLKIRADKWKAYRMSKPPKKAA